jgi:hypothetical protein
MVRYYSDDGVFDAPVEKVWKLIESHNTHMNDIHKGVISVKAHPEPSGSVLADVVTLGPDGKSHVNHKWRFTMKPPLTQTVEMIEGPMKGTWLTTTYLPHGNKTRLVTVAEWKVQGVSDDSTLHKMCDEFMENGFAEDMKFLATMH